MRLILEKRSPNVRNVKLKNHQENIKDIEDTKNQEEEEKENIHIILKTMETIMITSIIMILRYLMAKDIIKKEIPSQTKIKALRLIIRKMIKIISDGEIEMISLYQLHKN